MTTHQIQVLQRRTKQGGSDCPLTLKTTRLSKIFITHMHGDHIYGLPSLLSDIGMNRGRLSQPIDVYGPPGLSQYLKAVFQLTDVKCSFPCRVHELYADAKDPRLQSVGSSPNRIEYSDKRITVHPLLPAEDGYWNLFSVSSSCPPSFVVSDRECEGGAAPSRCGVLWLCVFFSGESEVGCRTGPCVVQRKGRGVAAVGNHGDRRTQTAVSQRGSCVARWNTYKSPGSIVLLRIG